MFRALIPSLLALSLTASHVVGAGLTRFRLPPRDAGKGPVVSSASPAPAAWLVAEAADWMARLPDSRPLGALSIPGTHDSGARFGVYLCRNQSWTLDGQLEAGVRYLDIRLRPYGDGFAIHHSPCFQNLGFDGVLASVNGFLERHPREAIILRAHEEYTPAPGSRSFADIWARYMRAAGQRFLPAMARLPSLGEARGRVLTLRDADFAGAGVAYDGPLTQIQDAWDIYDPPAGAHLPAGVVTPARKFEMIRVAMREASDHASDGRKLFINHLSSPGTSGPADFAQRANRVAFDYLQSGALGGPLGVIAMDYPGEDLIAAIIRANFSRE